MGIPVQERGGTVAVRIIAFVILSAFYLSYIVKLLLLHRQNIQVDILGKGRKPKRGAVLEIALKIMTFLGAAVQYANVIWSNYIWKISAIPVVQACGLFIMLLGLVVFISAIAVMKSNWRAGYGDDQNTELVTAGIYAYSRNPAFLGFDLLYIGCALAFQCVVNITISFLVVILFHLQIRGEKKFLRATFGQDYLDYKSKTMRYFGKKH